MEGTDADVIERMREQAGSFEARQDKVDERVNDGNNYKGCGPAQHLPGAGHG